MTIADNTSSFHLPVADAAATRRRVLEIVKGHRRELAALVVLHVCAIGTFPTVVWLADRHGYRSACPSENKYMDTVFPAVHDFGIAGIPDMVCPACIMAFWRKYFYASAQ